MDPSLRAISVLLPPSAANNTIRERTASACALVRRRVDDSNRDCSAGDNSTGTSRCQQEPNPEPLLAEI
jgi:hypothetical protein